MEYPFHSGEQDMHFKTGSWQEAESLGCCPPPPPAGRRMIKGSVGEAHAELLRRLPLLLLSVRDTSGRPWASALFGEPGFVSPMADPALVQVLDARLLDTGALPLRPGMQVGCLGLLPSSRRRVRLNGTLLLAEKSPRGLLQLRLQVQQCYSNCPKYIQKRTLHLDHAALASLGGDTSSAASAAQGAGALGPAQQALVCAADTFFIASCSGGPPSAAAAPAAEQAGSVACGSSDGDPNHSGIASAADAPATTSAASAGGAAAHSGGHLPAGLSAYGCDMSHRGGMPGFVQVLEGGHVLKWADYEGNYMFNTLGNLLVQPACCLLFLDFCSRDVLRVAGEAQVLHKDRELPGAQRAVRFVVHEWEHQHKSLPLRQVGEVACSPFNPGVPRSSGG